MVIMSDTKLMGIFGFGKYLFIIDLCLIYVLMFGY